MRQLPLDLALPPRLGRDDFLRTDANAPALDALDRWPDWPGGLLLLVGPQGSGKSHLAAIWQQRSGAAALDGAELRGSSAATRQALLIDDVDRLAGHETALFHLLNVVREAEMDLLMTASSAPDRWGLRMPDLLSRLRLAPLVAIAAPDDALVRAVLVKLFADRQLPVDDAVIAFLGLRLARSLADARSVVEALDRTALALNRRVTRPMAAQVLETLELDGEGA